MRVKSWHFVVIIILLLIYINLGHCSVAGPKQKNELELKAQSNDVTYLLGFVEDADLYRMESGTIHSRIRILPFGVEPWYDRTIDFCRDRTDMFEGKGSFVVLVYDRAIHKDNCNDLFGVFKAVVPTRKLPEMPMP